MYWTIFRIKFGQDLSKVQAGTSSLQTLGDPASYSARVPIAVVYAGTVPVRVLQYRSDTCTLYRTTWYEYNRSNQEQGRYSYSTRTSTTFPKPCMPAASQPGQSNGTGWKLRVAGLPRCASRSRARRRNKLETAAPPFVFVRVLVRYLVRYS